MSKTVKAKVNETVISVLVGDLEENRMLTTSFSVLGKVKSPKKIEKLAKEAADNMNLTFIKVAGTEEITVLYTQPVSEFIKNAEGTVLN